MYSSIFFLLATVFAFVRGEDEAINMDMPESFNFQDYAKFQDIETQPQIAMGSLGPGTDIFFPSWMLILIFIAMVGAMALIVKKILDSEQSKLAKKEAKKEKKAKKSEKAN